MRLKKALRESAVLLLYLICILLILSNISFLFGYELSLLNILLSFILSLGLMYYNVRDRLSLGTSALLSIAIIMLSYFVAEPVFDTSWDGQGYHQEIIYLLNNGWNPIYEDSDAYRIWVNLYQKGNEIIQANIYLATNRIEAGKLLNIILIYIALVVSWVFLDTLRIRTLYKATVSFLLVFNPVVFTQVFTYYIDGNWYLALLITFLSLLIYFSTAKLSYLIAYILCSVLFCSMKLTSIPVFVIFSCFVVAYRYMQTKKIIFVPFLCVIVLSLICNVHPFLVNITSGKHILHPFLGEKRMDIINQNIPVMLLNNNRFERLIFSLFSRTNINFKTVVPDALKIPFTFTKDELFLNYDSRLGGFGFLFSGVLILTVVLLIYSIINTNRHLKKELLFITCALLATILINPANWWPRLASQIWLIPLAFIIFSLINKSLSINWLRNFTIFILVVNTLVPAGLTVLRLHQDNKKVSDFINSVGNQTIILDLSRQFSFQQYYLKFKERNIRYRIDKKEKGGLVAPFTPDVYYRIE